MEVCDFVLGIVRCSAPKKVAMVTAERANRSGEGTCAARCLPERPVATEAVLHDCQKFIPSFGAPSSEKAFRAWTLSGPSQYSRAPGDQILSTQYPLLSHAVVRLLTVPDLPSVPPDHVKRAAQLAQCHQAVTVTLSRPNTASKHRNDSGAIRQYHLEMLWSPLSCWSVDHAA
jgi:hypothetical protein